MMSTLQSASLDQKINITPSVWGPSRRGYGGVGKPGDRNDSFFTETFNSECVRLELYDDKLLWVGDDGIATVQVVGVVARVTWGQDGSCVICVEGTTY